jgi:5-(carboxyamino)imidazole ribonucleotide synthase
MESELLLETSFTYDEHVSERFPTVGVIGAGPLARMMVAPAAALGIKLQLFAQNSQESGAQICRHTVGDYKDLEALKEFAAQCDLITFEDQLVPLSVVKGLESTGVRVYPSSAAFIYSQDKEKMRERSHSPDYSITVLVARSPHGQATSWSPTEVIQKDGISTLTIAPAQKITEELSARAQKMALDIANEIKVVGVMTVEMHVQGKEIYIYRVSMGPHESGQWTIDAARTSQFEQHLRAILDLPLGDPGMTYEIAVTGNIFGGDKKDMYRPYLHLMARNPDLKFHQYMNEIKAGNTIGHVTAAGSDLEKLIDDVEHACDYMSGVIDE